MLQASNRPGASTGGGHEYLEQLFADHVDAVFGFVLTRAGDRTIAEEVVSETFSEAARVLARDATRELERGWFFDVARKRLIDYWRREARHARRVERLKMLAEPETFSHAIDESDVIEALGDIPDRQRAAIVLHYLDGYRASDLAAALDLSLSATESLLARGRRNLLRAYLERTADE